MSDENTTPDTNEVLQGTPTPDQIKQQMEGQARIIGAAATLGYITQQAQGFLGMLTNNNPRLALAVANELALVYDEALRRSLQVADQTPPQAAQSTQVEDPGHTHALPANDAATATAEAPAQDAASV